MPRTSAARPGADAPAVISPDGDGSDRAWSDGVWPQLGYTGAPPGPTATGAIARHHRRSVLAATAEDRHAVRAGWRRLGVRAGWDRLAPVARRPGRRLVAGRSVRAAGYRGR
jgi:hypothetical protein